MGVQNVVLIAIICSMNFIRAGLNSAQIDVAKGIETGSIEAVANTSFDIGSLAYIFDGDVNTLARTPGINPLVVTLKFTSLFQIDSSRIYVSSHDALWSVETADSQMDMDSKSGSYTIVFFNNAAKMDVWDGYGFTAQGRILRLTVERITGDNYVHLHEWQLFGSVASAPFSDLYFKLDSLQLYENWRWQNNRYFATSPSGNEVEILPAELEFSSSDTTVLQVDSTGVIITRKAGTAKVVAGNGAAQAEQYITVLQPVLAAVFEPVDSFLTSPAAGAIYEIPIVVFRFLPTKDGINLDVSYAPDHWGLHEVSLEEMKNWIDLRDRRAKFGLEERTRFHGYRDSMAVPSLGYRVIEYITVYTQAPPGLSYGSDKGEPLFWPDYHWIFEQYDMQHYVNDLGVREIWMWINQLTPGMPSYDSTIHRPENYRGIWESNMASPASGDISNSNRNADDLPVYNSTYIVVDRNMRRSGPGLHASGHQLEVMLDYINRRQDGNLDLFRRQFVGTDAQYNFITGRCGWTHNPPNTLASYNYNSPVLVESDIEDWTPDRTGETKLVNVDTWASLNYAWPDSGSVFTDRTEMQWYVYWTQNMPGYGNQIAYKSQFLNNWWFFIGEWDLATRENVGLYGPLVESVSVFGDSSLFNGRLLEVGSLVQVYDNDGVLCGDDTVTHAGRYGPIRIFRDDFKTPRIDEGPDTGDSLYFKINEAYWAKTMGPDLPVWTVNGAEIELNLAAMANWPPEIDGLPDSLFFSIDSSIVLNLWAYVDDFETPDSLLDFEFTSSDPWLSVIFNGASGKLKLSSNGFTGVATLWIAVRDGGAETVAAIAVIVTPPSAVGSFDEAAANQFLLYQNYPNPCQGKTQIVYFLPQDMRVKIMIYNVLGQKIMDRLDEVQSFGRQKIDIDLRGMSNGIYYLKIIAGGNVCFKKLLLMN